jgi:hypothetical protein
LVVVTKYNFTLGIIVSRSSIKPSTYITNIHLLKASDYFHTTCHVVYIMLSNVELHMYSPLISPRGTRVRYVHVPTYRKRRLNWMIFRMIPQI